MSVINQPTCRLFTEAGQTTQLDAYYEEERRTMWMMLRAEPRPSFNHGLIEEIMNLSYAAQLRPAHRFLGDWFAGAADV